MVVSTKLLWSSCTSWRNRKAHKFWNESFLVFGVHGSVSWRNGNPYREEEPVGMSLSSRRPASVSCVWWSWSLAVKMMYCHVCTDNSDLSWEYLRSRLGSQFVPGLALNSTSHFKVLTFSTLFSISYEPLESGSSGFHRIRQYSIRWVQFSEQLRTYRLIDSDVRWRTVISNIYHVSSRTNDALERETIFSTPQASWNTVGGIFNSSSKRAGWERVQSATEQWR